MTSDRGDYVGGGSRYRSRPSDVFQAGSHDDRTRVAQHPRDQFQVQSYGNSTSRSRRTATCSRHATRARCETSFAGPVSRVSTSLAMAVVVTTVWSFTVLDASYGQTGTSKSFDATFEQHCQETYPHCGVRIPIHAPPLHPHRPLSPSTRLESWLLHGTVTVHGTVVAASSSACLLTLRCP